MNATHKFRTPDGRHLVPMLSSQEGAYASMLDLVPHGHRVRYAVRAGIGRHGPEWIERTGTPIPLLRSRDAVVCPTPGRKHGGTGDVVTPHNLLEVLPPRRNWTQRKGIHP